MKTRYILYDRTHFEEIMKENDIEESGWTLQWLLWEIAYKKGVERVSNHFLEEIGKDGPTKGKEEALMAKFFQRWWHYLFHCPSFWDWKPAFKCPVCGVTYRCYWDGNDCFGMINVCNKCAKAKEQDTPI